MESDTTVVAVMGGLGCLVLASVAAEIGVVTLIYLDNALKRRRALAEAEGAASRARTSTLPSWKARCDPR